LHATSVGCLRDAGGQRPRLAGSSGKFTPPYRTVLTPHNAFYRHKGRTYLGTGCCTCSQLHRPGVNVGPPASAQQSTITLPLSTSRITTGSNLPGLGLGLAGICFATGLPEGYRVGFESRRDPQPVRTNVLLVIGHDAVYQRLCFGQASLMQIDICEAIEL